LKTRNGTVKSYVLDTSAFFTLIEDEDGADLVQDLLQQAQRGEIKILASFVSFVEMFYITLQEKGEDEANTRIELMKRLAIERVESSEEIGNIAGKMKAAHKISFADAWIAATAKFYQAVLVHKDPEFEQVQDEVELLQLPYKVT